MPNLEHVAWSEPTVTPSKLAISSRLAPCATNSLIFSVASGVNFTRLALAAEGLTFFIVTLHSICRDFANAAQQAQHSNAVLAHWFRVGIPTQTCTRTKSPAEARLSLGLIIGTGPADPEGQKGRQTRRLKPEPQSWLQAPGLNKSPARRGGAKLGHVGHNRACRSLRRTSPPPQRQAAPLVAQRAGDSRGRATFLSTARWCAAMRRDKRLRSRTDQSRSLDWLKFKNPAAPAVRREAEGGLGKAPMTTLTPADDQGRFHRHRAGRRAIKCKPRREARDWCAKHRPASPIEEIGRGGKRAERQRSPYR